LLATDENNGLALRLGDLQGLFPKYEIAKERTFAPKPLLLDVREPGGHALAVPDTTMSVDFSSSSAVNGCRTHLDGIRYASKARTSR